jgi:hypothetical protein
MIAGQPLSQWMLFLVHTYIGMLYVGKEFRTKLDLGIDLKHLFSQKHTMTMQIKF